MAGSGLAPNPNSRRQTGNQAHTWTNLPASGYAGDLPEWPFANSAERELETWRQIWRTPQAAAWSTLGWLHEVALYVRVVRLAETGDMKAITEARLRALELGLTPTGMLKNRWRIAADEVGEKRTEKTAPKTKARRRLKVADDAVAGS